MPDIVMPKLSDSMEQGTILTWLKASGEMVEIGDEILEIETDKSTVTYAAEEAGTLETLIDEGTSAAVGTPIAHIGSGVAAAEATSPAPELPVAAASLSQPGSAAVAPADGATERGTRGSSRNGRHAAATPLARRVAAVHGVSLEGIEGHGAARADHARRCVGPRGPPTPTTTRSCRASAASPRLVSPLSRRL